MKAVVGHPLAKEVVGSGATKTSILTHAGMQVDVRVVTADQFGAALVYFTGSKSHNVALRQRAIDRGWLLNEYGLFEGERLIASETEESVYQALDLPLIPPTASGELGRDRGRRRWPVARSASRSIGSKVISISIPIGRGMAAPLSRRWSRPRPPGVTSTSPSPSTAKTWPSTGHRGRR